LLGLKAGQLPWIDTEGNTVAKENLPWIDALKKGQLQTNQMLRLHVSDEEWRTFKVNCAPVIGSAEKSAGVLISFDDVTQLEKRRSNCASPKKRRKPPTRPRACFWPA